MERFHGIHHLRINEEVLGCGTDFKSIIGAILTLPGLELVNYGARVERDGAFSDGAVGVDCPGDVNAAGHVGTLIERRAGGFSIEIRKEESLGRVVKGDVFEVESEVLVLGLNVVAKNAAGFADFGVG